MALLRTILFGTFFLGASACSGELPGHYYNLTLTTKSDGCNNPAVEANDSLEYRLVQSGNSVDIYIGESLLGEGLLAGCALTYTSSTWTDQRDNDRTVQWKVFGEAQVSLGTGCDAGDGWKGTERIEVVKSDDPDIKIGCDYEMDVAGTYEGLKE